MGGGAKIAIAKNISGFKFGGSVCIWDRHTCMYASKRFNLAIVKSNRQIFQYGVRRNLNLHFVGAFDKQFESSYTCNDNKLL